MRIGFSPPMKSTDISSASSTTTSTLGWMCFFTSCQPHHCLCVNNIPMISLLLAPTSHISPPNVIAKPALSRFFLSVFLNEIFFSSYSCPWTFFFFNNLAHAEVPQKSLAAASNKHESENRSPNFLPQDQRRKRKRERMSEGVSLVTTKTRLFPLNSFTVLTHTHE